MSSNKGYCYIKSFKEIKSTLDANNSFDGLRFMPEMIDFCGKKFEIERQVRRVAIEINKLGYLKDVFMLKGVYCDGRYHGNCSRRCSILWKKEWLINHNNNNNNNNIDNFIKHYTEEPIRCQSSTLENATKFIPLSLTKCLINKNYLYNTNIFDLVKDIFYGLRYIINTNDWRIIGDKKITPSESLGLNLGDVVQVKTLDEINDTLNKLGKNRGLGFQMEMVKYCGKKYHVSNILKYAIGEDTGKYREVKNSVILEDVYCDGSFHKRCERKCPHIWREIWLKKID